MKDDGDDDGSAASFYYSNGHCNQRLGNKLMIFSTNRKTHGRNSETYAYTYRCKVDHVWHSSLIFFFHLYFWRTIIIFDTLLSSGRRLPSAKSQQQNDSDRKLNVYMKREEKHTQTNNIAQQTRWKKRQVNGKC